MTKIGDCPKCNGKNEYRGGAPSYTQAFPCPDANHDQYTKLSTKQNKRSVDEIMGELIGHGFNDKALGTRNVTTECLEFYKQQRSELKKVVMEAIGEDEIDTFSAGLGDYQVMETVERNKARAEIRANIEKLFS